MESDTLRNLALTFCEWRDGAKLHMAKARLKGSARAKVLGKIEAYQASAVQCNIMADTPAPVAAAATDTPTQWPASLRRACFELGERLSTVHPQRAELSDADIDKMIGYLVTILVGRAGR